MQIVKTKKGLNLPVAGAVVSDEVRDVATTEFALLAEDYPYLKPSVLVKEGDVITVGSPLVRDKENEEVLFVSPVGGIVEKVMRGAKRAFIGITVKTKGYEPRKIADVSGETQEDPAAVKDLIVRSGLWTAIKTRPFGEVANPSKEPSAVFIQAIDTRPLAPRVDTVLSGRLEQFKAGVEALDMITQCDVYVCVAPYSKVSEISYGSESIKTVAFDGPHPAGLAGTHVHFLHPVSRNRFVWEINYQDIAAIGDLVLTGVVDERKITALCGEGFTENTLLRILPGTDVTEVINKYMKENCRPISGSILYGSEISGERRWLGRFDNQITAVAHGRETGLLSWLFPFSKYFSVKNIFLNRPSKYTFDTSEQGPQRAMVPVGSYEKIMPMDIIMTPFLRYIAAEDYVMAEKMGALELLEEDLSLATYVSPEKTDFAPMLRARLDSIRGEM